MKKITIVIICLLCLTQISASPKSTIYRIENQKAELYDKFVNYGEKTLYIYKCDINNDEISIRWKLYEDDILLKYDYQNTIVKDQYSGKENLFLTLDSSGLKLHSRDLALGTTTVIFPNSYQVFYNAYKHITYVREEKTAISNEDSLIKAEWAEDGHFYKLDILVEIR